MVTRRKFLTTNIAVAAFSALGNYPPMLADAGTQEQFIDNASAPSDRDFWNDWPNSITSKINRARESRRALLSTIQSKAQVEARNAEIRSQLWELLGGRPKETPLNPRITGTLDRGNYRIEKLVFESMPRVYVTANLYVPATGKSPFPAILAPIGHSPNGKAAIRYQYTYQTLARKGYIVLTWDPFGQGERIQYLQSGTNHTRFHAISMNILRAADP
ncbi:MAG TPA: hypothetical protein VE195_04485 [Acidobacteriaceae bacterium]|nr:hypothetical protein [Acidobacteriaceae bacterium]